MARKKYSEEFKSEIVRLVREGGLSGNKVAKEHNLAQATVARWVRDAIALEVPGALTREERAELKALRKENKRLKEDREILKKAAAFFAAES